MCAGLMGALVLGAAIAGLTAHEVRIGRREVEAADAAAARSEWADAVAHALAAAEARAPGSPWPWRGAHRLEAIGRGAEARGDEPIARLAYGALRAATVATRTIGRDPDGWRQRADEGLARTTRGSHAGARDSPDAMLQALQREPPPVGAALTALAVAAVAIAGGLARLAWPGPGPSSPRLAIGVVACGFALYAAVLLLN
jgi:hypothetical protein